MNEKLSKNFFEDGKGECRFISARSSKKLGISRETLQNYESGNTVLDIPLSHKIEEVYNFPVDYIFWGEIPLKALFEQ